MMDLLARPGVSQLADLVLILLLGATLLYVRRLERNLDRLRGDRSAFERMLQGFAERTEQAEAALRQFQTASDGISRELAAQIEVAAMLRGELATAASRAEVLARDLEAASVPAPPVRTASGSASDPGRERWFTAASEPGADVGRVVPPDDAFDDPPRSRAERELLNALRGMR